MDDGTSNVDLFVRSAGDNSSGPVPKLRVLLFGPDEERDPPSGDVTYVQQLLAHPPDGVDYVSYPAALAAGSVVQRGRRPRHGRMAPVDIVVMVVRGLELFLRRVGLTYREPTWFVTIEPGAFDLVHQHLFAVRQIGARTAVVSTSGKPLGIMYGVREGWSRRRIAVADAVQRWWARIIDSHDPHCRHSRGDLMAVYTERFRGWLVSVGCEAASIRIVATAISDTQHRARGSAHRIGFVGHNFDTKGGPALLEAYEQLRAEHPAASLVVATSKDVPDRYRARGDVDWIQNPTRDEVVTTIIPTLVALVLPTKGDCGAPYAVLESLRAGVPVVISDSGWLDEDLVRPAVLRCTSTTVAGVVAEVLTGDLDERRSAARTLWNDRYRLERLHDDLEALYKDRLS